MAYIKLDTVATLPSAGMPAAQAASTPHRMIFMTNGTPRRMADSSLQRMTLHLARWFGEPTLFIAKAYFAFWRAS